MLSSSYDVKVFEYKDDDFAKGVTLAKPETYYADSVMQGDMNVTFLL